MTEKTKTPKHLNNIFANIKMRSKTGEISDSYISKLRTEYKNVKSDKTKLKSFLKVAFKDAKDSGIGLIFTKDRLGVTDLFLSAGRQHYIKLASKKITKYHNINIKDVIARENNYKKIDEKLSKKKGLVKPINVKRNVIAKGIKTNYLFKFQDYTDNFIENVGINVDKVMSAILPKHKGQQFLVRLSSTNNALTDTSGFGIKKYGSPTQSEMKKLIEEKMAIVLENYESDMDEVLNFNTIGVSVITPPYGQILGAGGHRSIQTANKSWFISDQKSRTNCFYRCIATDRALTDYNKSGDLDKVRDCLITNDKKFLDTVNSRAKTMKSQNKIKAIRAISEADILEYVNKCYKPNSPHKCEVVIYNNVFQKQKTITPTEWVGDKLRRYEIQNINHHFIALVRWSNVANIRPILEEVIQIAKEKARVLDIEGEDGEDENLLIDKEPEWEIRDWDYFKKWVKETGYWVKNDETDEWDRHKTEDYDTLCASKQNKLHKKFYSEYGRTDYCARFMNPLNMRIGAYDLEATPNGVKGGVFKPYRLSFAYNETENDGSFIKVIVKTFGGEDCITKWFDWLYVNRFKLIGYTLYAHNGGKFDVLLLLNNYILEKTSKWVLEDGTLIVMGGAYLSFSMTSKEADPETINSVSHGTSDFTLKKNIKKTNEDEEPIASLITFRDSFRMLPASLKKLCDEFDVEHKKLSEVVNFDDVNINNCYGGELKKDKPLSDEKFKIELCNLVYCNYDVLGLIEILNIFAKSVYEACNGINITDCITGASLSKRHYFNSFYDKKITPVYDLTKEFDEFCRAGYYGGRCEAFYIGEQLKKLYYVDFTSLYPDVGRKRLPYGKPERIDEGDIYIMNMKVKRIANCEKLDNGYDVQLGHMRSMLKVRVKTIDFEALPLHAIKHENKLTFAHFGEWTEITMWCRELLYGLSLNIYEYEIIDGIEFKPPDNLDGDRWMNRIDYVNSPVKNKNGKWRMKADYWEDGILKDFFEDAVNKKALAKKQGRPAMAQAYKIIANSGYGFWGLNANGDGEGRDGMSIIANDDDYFWELMASDVVSNIGHIGDYMMVRTSKNMDAKGFNVAIAAAICSEARMKTYRFLKAVKDKGHNILYCDTDSCICDLKLNDYPDLMAEFCWDGLKDPSKAGDELGSLKNECLEKVEGYYKTKVLKEMGEDTPKSIWYPIMKNYVDAEKLKDDGELSFDKGIIAGCKQYSLHKRLIDGGEIVAGACKGCRRKLSYDEFNHLLTGEMIENQKLAESEILKRNPKFVAKDGFRLYERQTQFRSSTSDHITEGNYTDIQKIEIDKSVRINYTKGTVGEDGWVKPHIL